MKALLAADRDFLRPLVQAVRQELLEAEMTEVAGRREVMLTPTALWTTLRVAHKGATTATMTQLQKILDTTAARRGRS